MEIIKVEYNGKIVPNCSCGTGYSEPYVYKLTSKYNYKFEILIDIWYRSDDQIPNIIKTKIENYRWKIDNTDFVYNKIYNDILKRIK